MQSIATGTTSKYTTTTSSSFAELTAANVFRNLNRAMSSWQLDRTTHKEIKIGQTLLEWLDTRQRPETFRKWLEASTDAEAFRKKTVARLAKVTTNQRPAITGRDKSYDILYRARTLGEFENCGKFVKFVELPYEIRRKIWAYATPGRRVLEAFLEPKSDGVSVSRSLENMLFNLRKSCKEADNEVLRKYHKFWLQELFPITAPNFKTVLIDYENDIFHFTSSGAMEAALGKFGPGRFKKLKNIGLLWDHLVYWIKYFPKDLVNFLLKLKAVETIVVEARDPVVHIESNLFEGMNSRHDWLDLAAEPPNSYYALIEEAIRAYIETQPRLYHMREIRIWFFHPKSMHEKRFNRTNKSLV